MENKQFNKLASDRKEGTTTPAAVWATLVFCWHVLNHGVDDMRVPKEIGGKWFQNFAILITYMGKLQRPIQTTTYNPPLIVTQRNPNFWFRYYEPNWQLKFFYPRLILLQSTRAILLELLGFYKWVLQFLRATLQRNFESGDDKYTVVFYR